MPGATEPAGDQVLGNVVSAVADAIVVVDTAGVVRYGNPAAQELFARPWEELVGVELGFPVAPGETSEIDLLLPDGGSRVVEMRVTETTWEGEPVHVASLRDIGARWHIERELKLAVEQRDTVLAVAAHELRTPLAVILGMSEILRDGWAGLPEDRRLHLVDLIAKQAHQLRRLVRTLLTLSRIEAGVLGAEPVAFDTSELVLSRLPELGDRSRDVRVECVPGLVACADPEHLWQILANYIENAFKYGAAPVELSVAARTVGSSCGCATSARESPTSSYPACSSASAVVPEHSGRRRGPVSASRSCAASPKPQGARRGTSPVSPPGPASASGYRAVRRRRSRRTERHDPAPRDRSPRPTVEGTPIWADLMTPLRSPGDRARFEHSETCLV